MANTSLFAQKKVEFTHFSYEDGLPDNWVHDAVVAKNGVLWVATQDGLGRYNGQQFKIFKAEDKKPNIGGNTIMDIFEDENGAIWAAALDAGLSKFDPNTWKWQNWINDKTNTNTSSLKSNVVTCLLPLGEDTLLVGTFTDGLMLFSRKTQQSTLYQLDTKKAVTEPFGWNSIIGMMVDLENSRYVWLAANERGLARFDRLTGKISTDTLVYDGLLDEQNRPKRKNVKIEPGIISPLGRTGTAANCVWSDKAGELWIGTYSCGLVHYDIHTHQSTFFAPDNASFLKGNPYRNIVTGIVRKSDNELWISTLDVGLLIFNEKTKQFLNVEGNTKPEMRIQGISKDYLGRLLITGKTTGLYIAHPDAQLFQFTPTPSDYQGTEETLDIIAFSEEKKSQKIIFSAQSCRNLYQYDPQNESQIPLPIEPVPYATQRINCLFTDTQNRTWAGGTFDLDGKRALLLKMPNQNIFKPFKGFDNGVVLPDFIKIIDIAEDFIGNLYLATEGAGVVKIDFTNKNIQSIEQWSDLKDFNKKMGVSSLLIDLNGNIWAGTYGAGAICFSEKGKIITTLSADLLGGKHIVAIAKDKNGLLYIGLNSNGVRIFNPAHPNAIRKMDGLADQKIQKMLSDTMGNIWISTLRGLSLYQTNYQKVVNIGKETGLNDLQLNKKGLFCNANQQIFCAQKGGFAKLEILQFLKNRQIKYQNTSIAITDFQVFQQSILSDSLLQVPANLQLTSDQKLITFCFATLDFDADASSYFTWQLEGFDKEWNTCRSCKSATYNNLPGGKYKFKVRQLKDDGTPINGIEASMDIQVNPPFWESFWFKIAVLSALFSIIYVLFRRKLQGERAAASVRTRDADFRQREAEMKSQLAEYQQKTAELEMAAVRAQMNPHFIFNCLNSIHTFIVTNETEKAGDYLTKFARLIRLVLDNSRNERISLDNEISTLSFYIELEQMRFEGRFDFEIIMPRDLRKEEIQIPSMLIQPFVENAIWHGMLHNKGVHGKLLLKIQQIKLNGNDCLEITVQDNGVGRAKSTAAKSKTATTHKSHGLKITDERLQLLNQSKDLATGFSIADVIENGKVGGTKVVINIPILS
jgi:ligand-binding sensor domain-containing protein